MTAAKDIFQWCDDSLPIAGIILRTVVCQDYPGPVPDFARDDCLLFPLADCVLIFDLPNVGVVFQKTVNMISSPELPLFCSASRRVQFSCNQLRGLNLDEALKYPSDNFCFFLFNYKPFIVDNISKWNVDTKLEVLILTLGCGGKTEKIWLLPSDAGVQ